MNCPETSLLFGLICFSKNILKIDYVVCLNTVSKADIDFPRDQNMTSEICHALKGGKV